MKPDIIGVLEKDAPKVILMSGELTKLRKQIKIAIKALDSGNTEETQIAALKKIYRLEARFQKEYNL